MRAPVVALAACLIGSPVLAQSPALSPHARADTAPYMPRHQMPAGRQLVVVYVGGSEVIGVPTLVTAVRGMKPLLARQAAERGLPLSIIGVSLDWEVEKSIANLRLMGAWDELVAGNNWINVGAQRYVWRKETDGRPVTPQVILLDRMITSRDSTIEFGTERRLGGFVGIDEIVGWVRSGAPLPADVK